MKKIDLTINGRKYFVNHRELELKSDIENLTNSARRYQNITFYAQLPGFLTDDVLKLLNSRKGKWKSVKVWSERFLDGNQYKKFVETFSESVEIVELRNIYFVESKVFCNFDNFFAFKKLKILSLFNVKNIEWFLKAFEECKKLENLEVENAGCEALINFLSNFKLLKKLSLTEQKLDNDFFSKLSQLKSLKVEQLKLKTLTQCTLSIQSGVYRFLEVQADNITKLVLDASINSDVMQLVLKCSKLKVLHIFTLISNQLVDLPISRSINELWLDFDDKNILPSLIEVLPNLKVFKTRSVADDEFLMINNKFPDLLINLF